MRLIVGRFLPATNRTSENYLLLVYEREYSEFSSRSGVSRISLIAINWKPARQI